MSKHLTRVIVSVVLSCTLLTASLLARNAAPRHYKISVEIIEGDPDSPATWRTRSRPTLRVAEKHFAQAEIGHPSRVDGFRDGVPIVPERLGPALKLEIRPGSLQEDGKLSLDVNLCRSFVVQDSETLQSLEWVESRTLSLVRLQETLTFKIDPGRAGLQIWATLRIEEVVR